VQHAVVYTVMLGITGLTRPNVDDESTMTAYTSSHRPGRVSARVTALQARTKHELLVWRPPRLGSRASGSAPRAALAHQLTLLLEVVETSPGLLDL
jgi:hypothetical protein